MNKATYTDRKTFVKYDDSHVLLYLNEQPGEVTNPETGESTPATHTPETSPTALP